MSDSSTLALTRISVRFFAMTKSVGACMLAATVWPTLTLRAMTTPSIGARMIVWLKVHLRLVERGLRLHELRVGGFHRRVGGVGGHRAAS